MKIRPRMEAQAARLAPMLSKARMQRFTERRSMTKLRLLRHLTLPLDCAPPQQQCPTIRLSPTPQCLLRAICITRNTRHDYAKAHPHFRRRPGLAFTRPLTPPLQDTIPHLRTRCLDCVPRTGLATAALGRRPRRH